MPFSPSWEFLIKSTLSFLTFYENLQLWFTFKPVNVDADLQAVKQQCADLKDVVQITGGSVDEKGPSEAHYYFSCAVRAGTQSHTVAQPVIPDPMNMFGAMTSPETK